MNAPSHAIFDPAPGPTRVLVAEDHEQTRMALVFLLKRHGYDVTVVNDGQAAFELLIGSDPPQIAVLDWEMPRLDGLHVCRAVRTFPRAHYRYTYIVMVTARDQVNDALAAFAAGVDDFLSKPVDVAELLARLRCGERVLELEGRCQQRIADLEKTLEEVRQLKRLLPICMYCKKIRDDGDYWQEIENYIRDQTGTDFTHGICPSCMKTVIHQDRPHEPVVRTGQGDE